jgi:hypothetical protein
LGYFDTFNDGIKDSDDINNDDDDDDVVSIEMESVVNDEVDDTDMDEDDDGELYVVIDTID